MVDLDKWIVRIQTALTRAFVRVLKRSTVKDIKEATYLDESTTIYTFRSDGALFAQVTPFSTIIWNENRTEQLSEKGRQFVLRHECSHRDRNPIYKGALYGMSLTFAGGLFALVTSLLLLLFGANPLDEMVLFGVATCMMVSFVILLRLEETIADYYTIRDLGEEHFLKGYDEISTAGDDSLRARTIRKILYTHPNDTVRIYRFLKQFSNG
ncbi:M48 family metalloprotease [Natronorubrum sp. FCH18a]|uniref:M48 family metalloprotease n=1 Tax=Natronorubrum sp. FCH18a TaxID=3447018 RepID=UPI003F50F49E